MMQRIILFTVVVLTFLLRFWLLGTNPPSLDWDEASLGYNTYSISITGKDEYGRFLPFSIRSFDDYKPPAYTYLSIVPVWFFGLNEFSTRFISAFLGSLSVIVVFFLIKELFPSLQFRFRLLSMLFFSLSPWHLQFSRVAFEANIGLFFFLIGILYYLKGVKNGKYFFLSFLSFAASLYSYHSPRLVVPLIIAGLIVLYFQQTKKHIWYFLLSLILVMIIIFPLIKQIQSATGARFSSVTILKPTDRLKQSILMMQSDIQNDDILGILTHNRRIVFGREILAGYIDHFNFDFLFLTGDAAGRHHAVGTGMLYKWELPFIIAGIYYLIKLRQKGSDFLFWWFICAPIASSLTEATPHAVRSLLYLPTYQIFSAFGVLYLLNIFHMKILQRLYVLFFIAIFIANFFYYMHMYWIHTPIEYATWWQYGYKELVYEINKVKDRFDKIIITYKYDQPYIYFLFFNQFDPKRYQNQWGETTIQRAYRAFDKYEFRNIEWENDSRRLNSLIVGTPAEIPADAAGLFKQIYFPDGSVAFRLVAR